jgi:hypothetical protein
MTGWRERISCWGNKSGCPSEATALGPFPRIPFLRTWLNYRNHNAWMSRLSVSIAPASEDEFEHYLFGRRRKNPRKAK